MRAFGGWIVPAFRWHVGWFLALNAVLAGANVATGGPWWAFWPLLATGFLLALHYLAYKTFSVDDAWAEERTQDLNLKSYDRSHIEDLKSRYPSAPGTSTTESGNDSPPGRES